METIFHFLKYIFEIKKGAIIQLIFDFILFVLASIILYEDTLKLTNFEMLNVESGLLILLTYVKNGVNIYRLYKISKNYINTFKGAKLENQIGIHLINASKKEKNQSFIIYNIKSINGNEQVLYSNLINNYLQNNEQINIVLNDTKYKQIKNKIINRNKVLLPFLVYQLRECLFNEKTFTNDEKLCLSDDIILNSNNINCHKGCYFDSFLTNEIFGKYLSSRTDSEKIISDARKFFPTKIENKEIVLQDITESDMNNHIGISTIAITKDKYFVYGHQNRNNLMCPEMLVSSGSGSCDYSDLSKVNERNISFNDTVKNSMEREFREECGLEKIKILMETKILGFYRWVCRGGKPEFTGITKSNLEYKHFTANPKEIDKLIPKPFNDIDDLINIIKETRKEYNLSLPFYMNLLFLENYLSENILNQVELEWLIKI